MKGTKTQVKKTQKALQSGKKRQGKVWEHYRKRKAEISKQKITSLKRQEKINKELQKARGNVSYNWQKYRTQKYSYYHISRYPSAIIEKTIRRKKSKEEFYKVKDKANLDVLIENIFENPKVRYILVILVTRLPSGQIVYASDTFTKPAFERIIERGETVYNTVIEKFSFPQKTTDLTQAKLLSIHIRVIYNV